MRSGVSTTCLLNCGRCQRTHHLTSLRKGGREGEKEREINSISNFSSSCDHLIKLKVLEVMVSLFWGGVCVCVVRMGAGYWGVQIFVNLTSKTRIRIKSIKSL